MPRDNAGRYGAFFRTLSDAMEPLFADAIGRYGAPLADAIGRYGAFLRTLSDAIWAAYEKTTRKHKIIEKFAKSLQIKTKTYKS